MMEHLQTWQIFFLIIWLSYMFLVLMIAVITANRGSSEMRHWIDEKRFNHDLESDDERS